MVKKLILCLVLLVVALYVAMSASSYFADDKACLGGGYYVQMNTPTFHTVHGNNDVLLRGTVTKAHSDKGMIIGYLSLANARADSITDVLSQDDKEGFFAINTEKHDLVTGLDFVAIEQIASQHGIQLHSKDAILQPRFDSHSCKLKGSEPFKE